MQLRCVRLGVCLCMCETSIRAPQWGKGIHLMLGCAKNLAWFGWPKGGTNQPRGCVRDGMMFDKVLIFNLAVVDGGY